MHILPIINNTYILYKKIINVNQKLTKINRYNIGSSIENTTLNLLEYLIMAKNAPKTLKMPYLIKAGALSEIIVLKLRLYLELKLVNEIQVFQLQSLVREISRMIGGWKKSL